MAKAMKYYTPDALLDAPEHYALSQAMGILTWSTWDHGVRPVADRIRDFVEAYPPEDPVKRLSRPLQRTADGGYASASGEEALARFVAQDWRPGTLHELLARYGLKLPDAPPFLDRPFTPGEFRTVTRQRNLRLRVLHGSVDIEPSDMDAAKAELLDREEKKRAAEEVRAARRRMAEELMQDPIPVRGSGSEES